MKLCRFNTLGGRPRLGLVRGEFVLDLSAGWFSGLAGALNSERIGDMEQMASQVVAMAGADLPSFGISEVQLLAPVDTQEVWAAGVTYLRSKKARMEESDFSATAYDRVYDAERPELFFKSLPEKVVGLGEPVGIRKDARWNVPEPELALVINSRGKIVGYTVGNDMSSRDIEGENLLYLPQAKVYHRSCALGPWIVVSSSALPASTEIRLTILRGGQAAFSSATTLASIKRNPTHLVEYLYRDNVFPNGCFLLTGTGIVPPDSFTLKHGDEIQIAIDGIGTLANVVG